MLAGAVKFVPDIDPTCAPPDFASVIKRPFCLVVDFLFSAVPAIEVLRHTPLGLM